MSNYLTKINRSGTEYIVKDATHKDIKFYYPTGTAAKTSSPYYCSRWDVTDTEVTAYEDGMMVWLEVPIAGNGTYGTGFQINSLGYKPVVYNVNSMISTRYSVGARIWCVYNSTQTGSLYLNSASATTVTGCWQVMDYDSNTTMTYGTMQYYFRPYAGQDIYRYKFVAQGKDNRIYPITITNQENSTQVVKTPTSIPLRPHKIWFYSTTATISSGSAVGANTLMETGYGTTCAYNFNTTATKYSMIYLVGSYDSEADMFTLDDSDSTNHTSYYLFVPDNTANIVLSDYFTYGKYYWLLGATYSSDNYFSLFGVNPLYYFDGYELIPFERAVTYDAFDYLWDSSIHNVTLDGVSVVDANGVAVLPDFVEDVKIDNQSVVDASDSIAYMTTDYAITSLASTTFTPKTGVSITSSASAITSLATSSFTPKTGISVTSSISAIVALNSTTITPVTKKTVMLSATYSSGVLTFSTGDSITEGTAINVATPTPKTTASALQTISLTDGAEISLVTGASTTDTFAKSVSLTDGTAINVVTGIGSSKTFVQFTTK